jgi:hypothetical protein
MSAAGGTRGVRLDVERVLRIGAQSSGVRVETQVEAIHAFRTDRFGSPGPLTKP